MNEQDFQHSSVQTRINRHTQIPHNHYEPKMSPQIIYDCLKRSQLSQTCLGQNVSIWSQFETFLTFEILNAI